MAAIREHRKKWRNKKEEAPSRASFCNSSSPHRWEGFRCQRFKRKRNAEVETKWNKLLDGKHFGTGCLLQHNHDTLLAVASQFKAVLFLWTHRKSLFRVLFLKHRPPYAFVMYFSRITLPNEMRYEMFQKRFDSLLKEDRFQLLSSSILMKTNFFGNRENRTIL